MLTIALNPSIFKGEAPGWHLSVFLSRQLGNPSELCLGL
jgi:hypothetical protein